MEPDIKQQIDKFFQNYPVRKFEKDEILIFAGDMPQQIFYLIEGNVRQYDVASSGDEIVVNVFKPPAFFPMNHAINKYENDYIYSAATQVTARVAPIDDVLSFVQSHPSVVFNLLARVYSGIDGILRRQVYLMDGNTQNRLLFELVLSCHRIGELRQDGSYALGLTEAELAARVGISRETVSRRLQMLKKQGIVHIAVEGIIVTSLARLEKLLGESP